MAELGIIASVVQIADVGVRLSIKLYTFGEIVASADRSVISISKDISLTSGALKELGQILDQDRETRTFSENAVQTADGVVKECLEVFQEMDNILVKKMPGLAKGDGRDGKSGERTNKAMVMLERLKWGYLQPKLQLLRSNLDRLKSTLLLMLNVITYARQVSGKTESPSVIAEQRSLIEDLAHSNQEYIRKFERLKLGIDGTAVEQVDDASSIGAIEREPSTTTRSLPGAPTRKFERTRSAVGGIPLQDKENAWGLGYRGLTTATKSPPKAKSSVTRSLPTPPIANIGNVFINTRVQTNIGVPPVQERGIPAIEAPTGFDQEVLFKQLEHYSMLIKNLLKEVDKAQYKITFKSRLQVKGGIADLHESERQELERIWGATALQSAERRLESLVEGLGQLPRMNRPAVRDPASMFSPDDIRRFGKSPSMTPNRKPDNREQEEAAVWLPQATPDGRLFYLNSVTGASLMEDPPQMPISVNEAAAKERRSIGVSENTRSPTDGMHEAYIRYDSVPESDYYLSNKAYIKTSDSVPRALTDNSRSEGISVPIAEANTKLAEEGTQKPRARTLGRKNVKGLALAARKAVPAPSVGDAQLSATPRRDVEGTNYPTIGMTGRRTGHERLDQMQSLRGRSEMPEDARFSMSVGFGEDQKPEVLPVEKKDSTAPGEHFRQSQEEFSSERREKLDTSRESTHHTVHSWHPPHLSEVSAPPAFGPSTLRMGDERLQSESSSLFDDLRRTKNAESYPDGTVPIEYFREMKEDIGQNPRVKIHRDRRPTSETESTAHASHDKVPHPEDQAALDAKSSPVFASYLQDQEGSKMPQFMAQRSQRSQRRLSYHDASPSDVQNLSLSAHSEFTQGDSLPGLASGFTSSQCVSADMEKRQTNMRIFGPIPDDAPEPTVRPLSEILSSSETPLLSISSLRTPTSGQSQTFLSQGTTSTVPAFSNLGSSFESPTNATYNQSRREVAAVAESRKRMLHPSTHTYMNYSRPASTGSSHYQTPDPPRPAFAPQAAAAVTQPHRLPGIETFDQRPRRPATPQASTWSSMQIDPVIRPPIYPNPSVQPNSGSNDRRDHASWDMSLHQNLTKLDMASGTSPNDHLDKYGNVKGHAEPYEEPEEEIVDLSFLEEKVVDKHGNVVDKHGIASGHILEGDLEELVGRKVDGRGQISNDNGEVVGPAELLLGRGMQVQECRFAEIKNLLERSKGGEEHNMRRASPLLPPLEAEGSHSHKGGRPRKRRKIGENPSAIACTACRGKRIKCDRAEPKCVHCEQSGSACTYNTTRRNQGAGPDLATNVTPDPEPPVCQLSNRKQGDSRLADMEVVDRLVSLWTTVKPF